MNPFNDRRLLVCPGNFILRAARKVLVSLDLWAWSCVSRARPEAGFTQFLTQRSTLPSTLFRRLVIRLELPEKTCYNGDWG